MEAVKMLFRIFAYLFHGVLALFLLGVSTVALLSGSEALRLEMLPWTGATLKCVVFFGALLGLVLVLLSILGKLRPLFFVWTLLVMVVLLRGYIFGSYHFAGADVRTAIYLIVGSVIAALGGWFQMWQPRWKTRR